MPKDATTPVDTSPVTAATVPGETTAAPAKVRKPRGEAKPRPVFAVIQITGDDGAPVKLDKAQVKVISFEKSAEKVLEIIDGGQHEGALYLRGMLPPGR